MANPGMWQSPNRLYLNRDKTRVVPAGSPEQAHLLVAAGGEIPVAEAERYGLVKVREATVTAVEPEPVEEQTSGSEGGESEKETQETERSASEQDEQSKEAGEAAEDKAAAKEASRPESKAPTSGKR
jgi:hypothetical protein